MIKKMLTALLIAILLVLLIPPHEASGVASSGLKIFTEWAPTTGPTPNQSETPVTLAGLLLPSGTLAGPGRTADFVMTAVAQQGYGSGESSFSIALCATVCNSGLDVPLGLVTINTNASDGLPISIKVDGVITVLTFNPSTNEGTITCSLHAEMTDQDGDYNAVQVNAVPSDPIALGGTSWNLAVQWADVNVQPFTGSTVTSTMMRTLVYP
jgi:hypothetical protein